MKALNSPVPIFRVLAAFVIAPAVAALLLASLEPLYAGLPSLMDRVFRTFLLYLLIGGYPSAWMLGIPAYILFRHRLRPTPVNCASVGAAVATLPWLVLGLLSVPDYSYDGGRITVEHGHRTLPGWLDFGTSLGGLAAIGAFAGITFWIVAAAGIKLPKPPIEAAS